ncbi:hypothetical protein O181_003667 [Austropuccinia psidii MF-1]|uniref:Uncharacterized protein n=1 Tax=Austropuccinia psidii MF-1 TaxID=1389203 RepID=A0A9Q3BF89_9BASI|nr:hypothetical protein [Austropuccinia psidii MF-1]
MVYCGPWPEKVTNEERTIQSIQSSKARRTSRLQREQSSSIQADDETYHARRSDAHLGHHDPSKAALEFHPVHRTASVHATDSKFYREIQVSSQSDRWPIITQSKSAETEASLKAPLSRLAMPKERFGKVTGCHNACSDEAHWAKT